MIFTLLFLAFAGGLGYVFYTSVRDGKPQEIINGVDDTGNLCGVNDTAEYPFLYYIVQLENWPPTNYDTELTPVCAKACPLEIMDPVDCMGWEA